MYQLKTVADFDSAHFLSGYQGKCANIHGHRWHVEIEIQAEYLEVQGQMRGMLVDFGDLKRDLKKLVDEFDHTLIYESGTLREKTIEALLEEGFRLNKVDSGRLRRIFPGISLTGCVDPDIRYPVQRFTRLRIIAPSIAGISKSTGSDNVKVRKYGKGNNNDGKSEERSCLSGCGKICKYQWRRPACRGACSIYPNERV